MRLGSPAHETERLHGAVAKRAVRDAHDGRRRVADEPGGSARAASSRPSGGQSRVFDAPGCGVFAKTTIALFHDDE